MQLAPVGFEPISNSKFLLPMVTFFYIQFYAISDALKSKLPPQHFKIVNKMVSTAFTCTIGRHIKKDGRPILDQDRTGDNFLRKNIGEKLDGRQNCFWWTGDTEISAVLLYGV